VVNRKVLAPAVIVILLLLLVGLALVRTVNLQEKEPATDTPRPTDTPAPAATPTPSDVPPTATPTPTPGNCGRYSYSEFYFADNDAYIDVTNNGTDPSYVTRVEYWWPTIPPRTFSKLKRYGSADGTIADPPKTSSGYSDMADIPQTDQSLLAAGQTGTFIFSYIGRGPDGAFLPGQLQARFYWSDGCIDMVSASADAAMLTPGSHSVMRKGPYLIYPGDNTEMKVLWQLDTTQTATLEWGPDTSCSEGSVTTTEYGDDHQHAYTITGLTPGAHYYYRVVVGGKTATGSFYAAPETTATDLKFLVYGDSRSDPEGHNAVAGGMVSTYTEDAGFQSFVLHVGDLVANGDAESEWDYDFFTPFRPYVRRLQAEVPIQACMGNHEDHPDTLFPKYLPYPFVADRYWSFDYGPAHVVVVDQYVDYTAGSAQLEWMENDLASTTRPWKFILLHEPGWSAGSVHANNTAVQEYIQPLAVQYGVAVVFSGDNHYYARAVVDGVHHVTTGGGGAGLYTPREDQPYIVAKSKAHHYCKVEISGGSLTFTAVLPDGTAIDTFTITD